MSQFKTRAVAYALVAALALPGMASADTFMTVTGLSGDVPEGPYKGWLRVESVDASVSAGSNWTSGPGAAVGKPRPVPIKVALPSGPWSIPMLRAIAVGTPFTQVVIDHVGPDGRPAYRLRLDNVFLTEHRTTSTAKAAPVTEVSFAYRRIRYEVFTVGVEGRPTTTPLEWDVPTMQVVPAN